MADFSSGLKLNWQSNLSAIIAQTRSNLARNEQLPNVNELDVSELSTSGTLPKSPSPAVATSSLQLSTDLDGILNHVRAGLPMAAGADPPAAPPQRSVHHRAMGSPAQTRLERRYGSPTKQQSMSMDGTRLGFSFEGGPRSPSPHDRSTATEAAEEKVAMRRPLSPGTAGMAEHAAATVGMLTNAAERLSFDLEARQALMEGDLGSVRAAVALTAEDVGRAGAQLARADGRLGRCEEALAAVTRAAEANADRHARRDVETASAGRWRAA